MLNQLKFRFFVFMSLPTAGFVLWCMFGVPLWHTRLSMTAGWVTRMQTGGTNTGHNQLQSVVTEFLQHGTEVRNITNSKATVSLHSNLTRRQISSSNVDSNRTMILLFWSALYGKDPWVPETRIIDCYKSGYKCMRTSEKHFFKDSRGVVFHSRAVNLQSSVKEALKLRRPSGQRWVLYAEGESQANTPDLQVLNGLINWTASFMSDADLVGGLATEPGVFQDGFDSKKNYLENRTKMAAILVSHCFSERMNWVKKLQKYINVDVYGECGSLKCGGRESCFAAIKKYKFYLAFENSYCKDYITEKFYFNALGNGCIPVVISGVNMSNTARVPPGSFINALDFPTVKDLADFMVKVGSSSELYNEYFRWRSSFNLNLDDYSRVLCELCKRVHLDQHSVKSHPKISWWFSRQRCCKSYPIPH